MKRKYWNKLICFMLVVLMYVVQMCSVDVKAADISGLASESRLPIVLTLGADLSEDQKVQILQFFGIEISEVTVITITNQDEKDKLGALIPAEKIGSRTYSCALVNPTNAGGIQVKTANMNYVTSNMIAGQLSTSGVYNCEVLTAAPFEVSGTGALTGVMMAYEEASGIKLDEGKKELANVELVTTGNLAETIGQDQATLVVNDIKIHIVRDKITGEQEVYEVVNDVITVTETAAAEAAVNQGKAAPAKLGEAEKTKLYDFSYKFSQMDYDYAQMQPTLERITYNVTTSSGIDDPITDTFTTITEEQVLPSNSILLGTNDKIWGEDAIINATNSVAVADRPAEPINVYTGEVTLTSAGGVKADEFISGTNIIAYKDVNGSYALMDLNGNLLTDSIYGQNLRGNKGYIKAALNDGSGKAGVLATDGSVVVDFQYDVVEVLDNMWASGVVLTGGGTQDNYDYTDYENYYLIDHVDFYYIGNQGAQCVGRLSRDEYYNAECSGDYINVQARSGVITTYDSSFTALQTTDSLSNFGDNDYDTSLRTSLEEKTGYYVGTFYGKYAQISGDAGKGIMDRYGNIIIPAQFSSFYTFFDNTYEAGGYFFSVGEQQTTFVTAGGNVSAVYDYGSGSDEYYVVGYGMTAKVDKNDGGYILLSADGVETDLGTTYSFLSHVKESKGMLWIADADNGYDLLDWHGNVLISGSKGFSMSANGNYLIARDGYTSSTLYMINDAEPVDIANSAGGAQELQVEAGEAASLEVYKDEPEIEKVGPVLSEYFIDGTDLLIATNDGDRYAVMDVTDTQFTNPQFSRYMDYRDGWIIVEDADSQKKGVLSTKAQLVVPCEYDTIEILNEKWIIAYVLKPATEADYDFENVSWSSDNTYYQIDTARIYYIGEEEAVSVEITRDQIAAADADGDYLSIKDRTTGNVTIYDSSFTAVASTNYLYDFGDYSYDSVMMAQLEDKTGHSVSYGISDDGYFLAYDYNGETGKSIYGIFDANGEEIIPFEYDDIRSYNDYNKYLSAKGYFCVAKEGMTGYVTKGGEVSCELKYEKDNFYNHGISGTYKKGDGTYLIVAADGTESGPYPNSPYSFADGLFYNVSTIDGKYILVDWHGNELLSNYNNVDFSESGKYFIVREAYGEPCELYTVDGAEVVGVNGNTVNNAASAGEETQEDAQDAETAAERKEEPDESTPEATPESTPETTDETKDETDGEEEQTNTASPTDDSGKEILEILRSAAALIEADINANKAAIETLLKQARTKAESAYPGAASIIESAITLLDSDNPDSISVTTLITSATLMVE